MDVRPLPVERDGEATRLLARAFLDYPTWDAIAPRAAARREAMIRHYYGAELAVARRHGGTLLAAFDRDDLAGVALAFEPVPTRRRHGRWSGSPPCCARARALSPGPCAPCRRWTRAIRRRPLHTVGADPRCQRRGVGRALVSAALERANSQARPAYLLTSRPELVAYYRGFGFGLVGELQLPRRVTAWRMLREPT